MGLTPVTIERFPGLDLRADPGDSPGAIDMLNVVIEAGRVRSREGSSALFTGAGATPVFLQEFNRALAPHLIIADGTNIFAVSAAGTSLGSTAMSGASQTHNGVGIGTTAASFFYATSSTGTVKRWDGAAWTSPAGFPAATRVLSLSPTDNRLVACSSNGKVNFSDAGVPETFGANNFVYLTPGDGEEIQGAAVFNNQLFIFKQTRFFVFYGTSIDSTGNPIFNYRTVDAGLGIFNGAGATLGAFATAQAVCSAPGGVYFVASDGVYVTTGGPPTKVSAPLDPFFRTANSPNVSTSSTLNGYWQGGVWRPTVGVTSMTFVDGRLYVSVQNSTVAATSICFVLDPRLGVWSAWSLGGRTVGSFVAPVGTAFAPRTLVFSGAGPNVNILDTSLTTDNGAAIVSRYRLPFENYGSPNKKRIRETLLDGTGTLTAQWSKDWGSLLPGSSLVLGTLPAVGRARQRLASTGKFFSLQVGAASGYWSLNRVQANVSDVLRRPEIAG